MKLLNFANWWKKQIKVTQKHPYRHSGRMDSKTIHSTIDAPPGVPGVSKNQKFSLQMKVLSFCAKIAKIMPKTLFLQTFLNIL